MGKKLNMKMGASCISMFVKTVLQKVNLTLIQRKIVDKNYKKKRVGHCSNAVPASTSKKYFSARIVVNSDKYFVQSDNWRQDWWFCNNVSYADVVKNKEKIIVSNVQLSNMHDQEVKYVENHVNTITKREYNVDKNIRVHCSKTLHQNMAKMRPKCQ